MFEEATEGEEGKNMVISLLQLVVEKQQEIVTLACQQSLAHQLLDQPGQLSGPWLALAVSVVVMLAAQQDLQGGQSQHCQCGVVPGMAAGLAQPPRPQSGGDRGQGGLGWGEELDDDDVFLFGESCALN
jgi:hypothetical protein